MDADAIIRMDLYAVLGLVRGASAADIKRAYRRLARRYHPGINPGDGAAAAMFQRITEAYETLLDPARREQYDTGGAAPRTAQSVEFAGFDFTVSAHGPQAATFSELFADVLHPGARGDRGHPENGADLHATLAVSFVEALRGVERQVIVTRLHACPACRGTGAVTASEARCVPCHGSGHVRWARGHMVFAKECVACGGSGRQRQQRCAVCAAQGRVVRSDAVTVRIPPGTADGLRVRLPEQGHAGRAGGGHGDLYVTVQVTPHERFRREGDDVHVRVPVAVHEAVLGARIEVASFDGPVRLRIPPGAQGGQRFCIPDRGAASATGGRGDLIVETHIVLPAAVDEESRELLRRFGERNAEDVRKDWTI